MTLAALYDIHGNLPALEAVLAEIQTDDIDGIVIGGDVVPGPFPRECVDLLLGLDLPVSFLHGNGDREVVAAADGAPTKLPEAVRSLMEWTASRLDAGHIAALRAWPDTVRAVVDGIGDVLFCHAVPTNDTEIFTKATPEERLLPAFADVDADLVVCGHTHMQFDRRVGTVRVVNAGSVGMPFGTPGAYWLRLGPDVVLRRTAYDLEGAAARVRASDYPQAESFAAKNVLSPMTEAEALALYSPP